MTSKRLAQLEGRIGYHFKNALLLEEALTHPSLSHVSKVPVKNYERLEFLGDAIIGFLLAEWLYEAFPEASEGFLSSAKASLVKGKFLSELAQLWELGSLLRVNTKDRTQVLHENARILGSILESCIGAIYLDGGVEVARNVLCSGFAQVFNKEVLLPLDVKNFLMEENPKGKLQEWVQGNYSGEELEYVTLHATGPGHSRLYKVAVKMRSKDQILGTGEGPSQKAASEQAALIALRSLK